MIDSKRFKLTSFYGIILFLVFTIILLSYGLFILIKHEPTFSPMIILQCINTLSCYILLGVGIGLPLVILATTLGWVQLILLLSGNVSPHFAKEGFFNVLRTLFTKI